MCLEVLNAGTSVWAVYSALMSRERDRFGKLLGHRYGALYKERSLGTAIANN